MSVSLYSVYQSEKQARGESRSNTRKGEGNTHQPTKKPINIRGGEGGPGVHYMTPRIRSAHLASLPPFIRPRPYASRARGAREMGNVCPASLHPLSPLRK